MVLEPVFCPNGGSNNVVKHGRSGESKQRYKCRNSECGRSTFIRDYAYPWLFARSQTADC